MLNTHIFSIQRYIDFSTLDYDLVHRLTELIPKRLLHVVFLHCTSTYLFIQYPAFLELHALIKDIIYLPKDTKIYKGSFNSDLSFMYPSSFTTNKDVARHFGTTVISTTIQDQKYIYLSPELLYVVFHVYKGFSKVPCQDECIMLTKMSDDAFTIETFDTCIFPEGYEYSKDEMSYPCISFNTYKHTRINNKYVILSKYHSYDKLLTYKLNYLNFTKSIPNETIYLYNKYMNIWKKLVVNMYKWFNIDLRYNYQMFMDDIENTNNLIFKLNVQIFKVIQYLVRHTFDFLKLTVEDTTSNSIVIINKELFYLIRCIYSTLDKDIQYTLEQEILNTKLNFSLEKSHMFCVGNTNDDNLVFYKTIQELGYTDIKDIFNMLREYIFMHAKYANYYIDISYVHTSVSLLLHAMIEILQPYIDYNTYLYIEQLHLNLI